MCMPMRLAFLLVAVLLVAVGARAQVSETQPEDLTRATIEARLADLESATGLDDTTRASVSELLQNAIGHIQRAAEFGTQAAEFRRLAADAPALLATIRDELAKPAAEPVVPTLEESTLQQLDQALSQATANLEASRLAAADLQSEAARRIERRTVLPEQIARVRQLLGDLDDPASATPGEGEAAALFEARRTLLQARQNALLRELEALESEASSYDARRDVLPARRDRAQRRVTEAERLVAAWQELVAEKRQAEAEVAAREAQRLRQEAARQHPVLRRFAEETAARASARTGDAGVANRIDVALREKTAFRSGLAELHDQFSAIQRKLDVSGLNRATGLLLRRQMESLPEVTDLRRRIRTTQNAIEDVEYLLVELDEERAGAGDVERIAQDLLAEIPPQDVDAGGGELAAVARELAAARRDLLDQIISESMTYADTLHELDTTLVEYVAATDTYADFIEERILWVRSVAGDPVPAPGDVRDAITWLFDPASWRQAGRATLAYLKAYWFAAILGALVVAGMIAGGTRARQRLRQLGERVSRYHTDSFVLTLLAILFTMRLALPGPLALFLIGWLLQRPAEQVPVAVAAGAGLQVTALFLFPLTLLRQVLRPRGLAEAHFRWASMSTEPLRRELRWFILVIVPLAFLVTTFERSGNDAASASMGRIAFSLGLLALAIFLHRVLRPSGPVLRQFIERNKAGWVHRLRFVWHPLVVLGPLALIVITWLGFYYTAMHLESRLEASLLLALVLVLVHAVMSRWLMITRRRVAVEDARRRREQAAAAAATKSAAGEAELEPAPAFDEDKVDLPALSEQSRQLFRAAIGVSAVLGLYIIWADALPALRMLDRVQVWPSVSIIDLQEASAVTEPGGAMPDPPQGESASDVAPTLPGTSPSLASGAQEAPAGPSRVDVLSITIADIGLSLIVLLVTWVTFKNVPGLVEMVVLQRLPLDAGSRYALSTVLRYAIAIVGVIIASNAIGIPWTKVQWLAAALTFGLAFGLQEIFANFVSGLIVLAERPIRLGDTVTVGGTTGTVTRIRMRATTITDWDRKELVIPNKTFITNDVINWTLSDPVLRVTIPVGVSYESDIDRVESELLSVARSSSLVLTDPKPHVVFRNFGDSTLDFELRVFISHMDVLVSCRHEMHRAITKAFRAADIEIAFPQRDLHVRSAGDLAQLVHKREHLPASDSDER